MGQAHARDFGSDQRGRALLGWGRAELRNRGVGCGTVNYHRCAVG